jgi:hypothetical protein
MVLVKTSPRDRDDGCRGAARLGHDLGIRRDTYIEAVSLLGCERAALALLINAERDARNENRLTARCYFAGMTERACSWRIRLCRDLAIAKEYGKRRLRAVSDVAESIGDSQGCCFLVHDICR